jgi:hypothetical protein
MVKNTASDQAPMESQEPVQSAGVTPHTVGPDFPGVTGTPDKGTRDMDRVKAEGLDDDSDDEDDK